ncbi:MAG: gamma-glutamyltranspeptidase / glutathione hydrolase [Pseudonocardiales bacterium]|jgi:gamma-glutamyltranspeptidase/glutathione hydrolase|nr:gamma-glutamyltranspeptidase / glutathione hydrolase [Pseudonocardiales bacterium]
MTTRPELTGNFGMVASTHWLASAVGMSMLERGGNAFDAAVAAGFTLQVVEPHLNGAGGEVPILVRRAGEPDVQVIAGQGPAPMRATAEHFADLGLDLVPGTGHLAACVPGAFDAWLTLLEQYGTMPVEDVLAPAISYARQGYPVLPSISRTIAAVADLFTDHWPTSAAVYLRDGAPPAPGTRLTNPVLADTYERMAATARGKTRDAGIAAVRDAYYRGFVAEAIDAFVRQPAMDTSGTAHAGVLTADDLAAWSTPIEAPATYDFGAYRVAKTSAWGQGPVLLQQLALLAGFDLADTGPADPRLVHTVVECAKLAFADREAFYGDVPDVPLRTLLSTAYNDERRRLVTTEASGELRPGSPDGRAPRLPTVTATHSLAAGVGEPTLGIEPAVDSRGGTRGDTCHVDVVDRFGNMVSATPSGGWLQSSPVIPSLGFGLGTRAQMFWLQPGLPNSIAPGKRPRTTLSPSLALRDGDPYLAFGTPGGDQQDQWQLQFFLFHAVFGLHLQEAIDAATWHTTHFPSSFYPRESVPREVIAESRLGDATINDLRRRGHDVTVVDGWSLGRLSAATRSPDGFLRAGANPRGAQGYAVGR